jgi:universal stress protein A
MIAMNLNTPESSETDAQSSVMPSGKIPELHLKKILAATDFSECSRKAFHYAVCLGKQYKAELILLHIFEPAPPQVDILEGAMMDTSLHEDLARQLEDWRCQASAEVKTSPILRDGTLPYKQIVAIAQELEADLIIVGNRGRNAIGRALMGSTAEKVVRFAPCPVLVIREREHDCISESV